MGGGRVFQLLHVVRDDERGRRPPGQSRPDRAVQHVGQLFGHGNHLDVVAGHVLEQAQQVDFLLIGAAHRAAAGLPDDRQNRYPVKFGVVEAVEQMNRTRAGCRGTYPKAATEFRIADRFERGHFLVARLDEHRFVVGAAPRGE